MAGRVRLTHGKTNVLLTSGHIDKEGNNFYCVGGLLTLTSESWKSLAFLLTTRDRQREGEKRKKRKGKPSVPFCWTYDRQSGHQTVVRRNCNGWKLYILAVDIYCKRCVQRNKLGQPEKKTLQTIRTVATKTSRNYVTRRNEMPQVVLSFVISIEWQNSCVIT